MSQFEAPHAIESAARLTEQGKSEALFDILDYFLAPNLMEPAEAIDFGRLVRNVRSPAYTGKEPWTASLYEWSQITVSGSSKNAGSFQAVNVAQVKPVNSPGVSQRRQPVTCVDRGPSRLWGVGGEAGHSHPTPLPTSLPPVYFSQCYISRLSHLIAKLGN